ncbi:hypothetical protein [Roseobacter sp. CCS2]|uniref:hypothetical protein n=1 Tax=Roseobacter sp. CCS2 TaxID=391593 RepID=UPI0000F40318|nr:hypothetical protein [Roseobacter sp. CCS2]EBA13693.1 hypothetical protein RCCS2_07389 [Roseobacter sp. CCS2]
MTDATDFSTIPRVAKPEQPSVPLPAPVPFGAPVLISDCVNPLAGETLLSLLWKRLEQSPDAD